MKRPDFQVIASRHGIDFLKGGSVIWRAAWDEIRRVTAYQADEFTIDTRWLEISTEGEPLRVSEDTPGYAKLEEELGRYLPAAPEWQSIVSRTAFDRNEVVVYDVEQQVK